MLLAGGIDFFPSSPSPTRSSNDRFLGSAISDFGIAIWMCERMRGNRRESRGTGEYSVSEYENIISYWTSIERKPYIWAALKFERLAKVAYRPSRYGFLPSINYEKEILRRQEWFQVGRRFRIPIPGTRLRSTETVESNRRVLFRSSRFDFSRIVRRRVLSFSTRFSRSSTWRCIDAFDENSDVITYKVTTLFSVYGYRLLRRYRELLRPRIETAIENKRRNIWIISLVVFEQRFLTVSYRYWTVRSGEIVDESRENNVSLRLEEKKRKSCQKLSSALQSFRGRCIFLRLS